MAAPAAAQSLDTPAGIADEAALPRIMPSIARAFIDSQPKAGPADLAALFRAQLVTGQYDNALASLDKLRASQADNPSPAEDDARRYTVQKNVQVAMPDGAGICALIVRPTGKRKLPTQLQFTIYNDAGALFRDARRAASNDYAGVMGLTRGKGCSSGDIIPYEHDGANAAALIDWIAAQPWSDGKVGMYGGSYSGFTPWVTAKHHPKALNEEVYNNRARWAKLDHDWYVSGRPYRDLDQIDGIANPIFDRWISHPDYDAYWQNMIPYQEEFARISIPVLRCCG